MDELLICGDAGLRHADNSMGEEYRQLRDEGNASMRDKIIRDQREWVARRNAACGLAPTTVVTEANRTQFVSCLAQQYTARMAALSRIGTELDASQPRQTALAPGGNDAQQQTSQTPPPSEPSPPNVESKSDARTAPTDRLEGRQAAPESAANNGTSYGLALVAIVLTVPAFNWYRRRLRRQHLITKYGDAEIADKIMRKIIWQGMSEAQLVDSWGMPADKAQQVLKTKITEIFKYNRTGKNRFGSRVRVDNGIVVGWEQKGGKT